MWNSFYAWLVAKHGAVEGGPSNLCNRTYAGGELMDRLNLAHGEYLRRTNYDLDRLVERMSGEGWALRQNWRYSEDFHFSQLVLFQSQKRRR